MEFQDAWSEAMMIGQLCQCQSALLNGVGEFNCDVKGGAVRSISQAPLMMGEGVIEMVSSSSDCATVEVSARGGMGGGEKVSLEMVISDGVQ